MRDKNEEGITYGQQVALCVFEADYLIRNDNDPMITTKTAIKRSLRDKLEDAIRLFKGELRPPTSAEAYMSIAYSASLMSQCIKRQVGAVIIDKEGAVVSIGYNENPRPLKPCYMQFGDCYREIFAENTMGNLKSCPFCRKELNGLVYPYVCPHCNMNIYREIVRDRALSRCTALHAEEKAIINAHTTDLNGCTLYVTTFPCFNCAQKMLDVGIRTVYYVESYPDIDSVKLFNAAKKIGKTINIQKFEGVKARAYFKIFDNWRRQKEADLFKNRYK
jgi:deoxycytidylate deaminase